MEIRTVKPELLDELDSEDPRAIRSRRDLRVINWMMRGQNWIVRQLAGLSGINEVIELGAGDGNLTRKIHTHRPEFTIRAIDLAPRPNDLAKAIQWLQQDIQTTEFQCTSKTALIANLFLHHFEDDTLRQWGDQWSQAGAILIAEPYRSAKNSRLGRLMHPFVNHVTRHDMQVSIEAGFQPGEIPGLLGNHWQWQETWNFFGSLRSKGVQR